MQYAIHAEGCDAVSFVDQLHAECSRIPAIKVSPILSFEDEACLIQERDPYALIKQSAHRIGLYDGQVIVSPPQQILSFVIQLPNNRISAIGLAKIGDTYFWSGRADVGDNRFTAGSLSCINSGRIMNRLVDCMKGLGVAVELVGCKASALATA